MESRKTHLCYVCGTAVSYDQLSYECMCFNPNTELKYRGVCNLHNPLPPKSEWKHGDEFDSNHSLRKIVKMVGKGKEFWDDIEKNIPEWSGMISKTIDGKPKLVFSKYEQPADMPDDEYQKVYYDEKLRHKVRKEYIVDYPSFMPSY